METFSALLTICTGNSPVTGKFPAQRPVTRSSGVFFDLRLNKQLSKQSWGWWFETPTCSSWRHCNENKTLCMVCGIQYASHGHGVSVTEWEYIYAYTCLKSSPLVPHISVSEFGSALVQIMAWRRIGAGLLPIGPLGTNFHGIWIKMQNFSFKQMHLKTSSAKWRPFCPGVDELICQIQWGKIGQVLFLTEVIFWNSTPTFSWLRPCAHCGTLTKYASSIMS